MAFQVMMMKKTMSRKRGRLRGSLKTAKGKKGIKIQPKVTDEAVEETSIHESPGFEKVQEKRTESHEAMVDDGGNIDTDIQEVTVESIKETEVPDVLLAEEKGLSPPCSPPRTRSRYFAVVLHLCSFLSATKDMLDNHVKNICLNEIDKKLMS
ncbi:unnamed protein product [Sphagnum jensenii]|uniref:Uncharacterized protein n=1 Tax=Sphagnum jensenii TaxID=128206 RepID=A0ABP0W9M2_9BRYO